MCGKPASQHCQFNQVCRVIFCVFVECTVWHMVFCLTLEYNDRRTKEQEGARKVYSFVYSRVTDRARIHIRVYTHTHMYLVYIYNIYTCI